MHDALLIDEIIREIFSLCGGNSALVPAARTCKAWKDPALDAVWRHLGSIQPLLDLIIPSRPTSPGIFYYYAVRVRSISLRQSFEVDPGLLPLFKHAFPRLSSIDLYCPTSGNLAIVRAVPNLRQLTWNLGSKPHPEFDTPKSLETLCLRGKASASLSSSLSSMTELRSLSLFLGSSLTEDTLNTISSLPNLTLLKVHVDHLFDDHLPSDLQYITGEFPSLSTLQIRGDATFIALLLNKMQSNQLLTLHIELTTVSIDSCSNLLTVIRRKSQTLHDLTIEHHIELDDLDSYTDTPLDGANIFPFDIISLLAPLSGLRRLTLDTTIPPTLSNQNVEKLVKWWPNLISLDLGSHIPPNYSPKMDLASLNVFARALVDLESLVIPLDMTKLNKDVMEPSLVSRSKLARLTITAATPVDPLSMAQYLGSLFPSLEQLDGMINPDLWDNIQSALVAQHP
ncbi:hypothetical protein C8J56DRAFT_1031734 [Mycena floridula]|nr:hypothetical protein C8J56DRAFT_1031734 [Mycena floridula]